LPLQSREQIVADLRSLLTKIASDSSQLESQGIAAQAHVRRFYTWEAKAEQIREVYRWALRDRAEKPCWGIPMGLP
jgi:glycosyltransferase involved in cell wall biosynthesis